MGSLIDYAHTKMFFIKGWSLSDKVFPIVVCFFFCYKFLVTLRRQGPIGSVAAQHWGFQSYAKLARLSRLHFPFICHFLHRLPLRSPRGTSALCIARQQCREKMDGKVKPSPCAHPCKQLPQRGTVLQVLDQRYVWRTHSRSAVFSKASGAVAHDVVGADRTKRML